MKEENNVRDGLVDKSRWEERPFTPTTSLIGPLAARLRRAWLLIAERGFVLPLWQQQNRFNDALVNALDQQDEKLVAHDRAAAEMRPTFDALLRETRQLQKQIDRLNRRIPTHPS